MRVRTADILLMENSKEISVLNATKLIGSVLNVDSSLQLQCLRIHAHNAMKSAIFLMLLAIPRNAEAQDILIQGYRGESIFFALASYVSKFMKVLPGRKVAGFYQAENRFDTAAIAELYSNIPGIR